MVDRVALAYAGALFAGAAAAPSLSDVVKAAEEASESILPAAQHRAHHQHLQLSHHCVGVHSPPVLFDYFLSSPSIVLSLPSPLGRRAAGGVERHGGRCGEGQQPSIARLGIWAHTIDEVHS